MIRCLVDDPAPGPWNMALDEALMDTARQGEITLRFYGWEPGTLSFGRNEAARWRYDEGRALAKGLGLVRRPTGGRAVFHHRELTYSLTAPARSWGGLRETYLKVNRALRSGLMSLGVPADLEPRPARAGTSRPAAGACFRQPLPGELTAGGRKLVGSAQWRERGALLQHGSILLHNDQEVVELLRVGGVGPAEPVPAVGLAELLPLLPPVEDLMDALVSSFGREFGRPVCRGSLRPEEKELARGLVPRYRDDSWTWRR